MIPSDPYLLTALHIFLRKRLPLLPEDIDLAGIRRVMDVGCGPHHWGRDLLRLLTEQFGKEVATTAVIDGIDNDLKMVRFAYDYSRASRSRVIAYLGDMYHLPPLFLAHYDLVHARFLSSNVQPQHWPRVLTALAKLCTPGGWLIWCEPSLPTRTPRPSAWNQLLIWIEQALDQTGSPGMAERMETPFMQVENWSEVIIRTGTLELDLSAFSSPKQPPEPLGRLSSLLAVLRTSLLATGVTTAPRLDETISDLLDEVSRKPVVSQWTWKTICGRKS